MKDTKTIDFRHTSARQAYHYLVGAVGPRPIAFASTISSEGNINLSPFSFFNAVSSNPPMLLFSPALRGRDSSKKDTLRNVGEVPEVTISVVTYDMVQQMSLTSAEFAPNVNEFTKAGLTPIPSQEVKPPRVGESPIAFECQVDRIIPLGDGPASGVLVLAQVKLMHVWPEYLDAEGRIRGEDLDLVGRLGGNWYSRASGEAVFEIPKPVSTDLIGFDQLPEHVRHSSILSGNDLAILASQPSLPSAGKIKDLMQQNALAGLQALNKEDVHLLAKKYIRSQQVELALAILLWSSTTYQFAPEID